MSNQGPGVNPNVPQIPSPVGSGQGGLALTADRLKQAVDNLAGFSGGQFDRAVTFRDLIRLGLADATTIASPNGAADFATNTALANGINGIPGTAHTFTQEQIFNVGDNNVAIFVEGSVRGMRFYETTAGSFIEGRDQNNSVYDPITIGGSTVNLSISGTNDFILTASGLTVSVAANFTAGIKLNGFNFATQSTNYNIIYDNAGDQSFYLGNATDPTNYYWQGQHVFGSIGGVHAYFTMTSTGVEVYNASGTAPTGGLQGAGTINAFGYYIGGVPLQTVATNNQTTVTAPAAGSTSGTGVMMGLAGSITPSRSGTVKINIYGTSSHSSSGGSMGLQIRTGTGSAPANGTALTGTAQGLKISPSTASAGQKMAFNLTVIVTGLAVGTAIWIDLSLDNGGSGTATVQNLVVAANEL